MIKTIVDKNTKKIWNRQWVKALPQEAQRIGLRKLLMVHSAVTLDDLKVPPGNRLEKLDGDRAGQFSIRINDQYRVCFRWSNGDAYNVEITDYH